MRQIKQVSQFDFENYFHFPKIELELSERKRINRKGYWCGSILKNKFS